MWKRFEDNIVAELNKINAYINLEILIVVPERNDCCWSWLKLFLIVKGTAKKLEKQPAVSFSATYWGVGILYIYVKKKKAMLLLTTISLLLEYQYTRQDFRSLLGCLFGEE